MRNAYKILVGEREVMRPLGISSHKFEDNINEDLKLIECEVMDWILLVQNKIRGLII
jgi:hypothetical protein